MKKSVSESVSVLFMCLLLSPYASCIGTWTPGIAAGDYFYYDMYGVYTSNHPNETIDIPQFEYNNTEWTRINITRVEGSVVHQIYTLRYKNGSETSFNFTCDVNPESNVGLQFNQKGVPLCAANLNVGDIVPTDQTAITETASRSYACGNRETNHASWNSSADWGGIYFDRETGMLVELCRTHRFSSNSSDVVVDKTDVIKITSTNRWQVTSDSPRSQITLPFAVATITIFALLVAAVVTQRYLNQKKRRFASAAAN